MLFTSVSGHITNCDFTAAHNSWYEKIDDSTFDKNERDD
jgi:hypothetical protein